jgi:hypothetical protein
MDPKISSVNFERIKVLNDTDKAHSKVLLDNILFKLTQIRRESDRSDLEGYVDEVPTLCDDKKHFQIVAKGIGYQ